MDPRPCLARANNGAAVSRAARHDRSPRPGPPPKQSPFRRLQIHVNDDKTRAIAYSLRNGRTCRTQHRFGGLAQRAGALSARAPLVAAIAQYQLVTIHPWMDGQRANVASARQLHLFCKNDYDLKGFFSIEEQFDLDLGGYYGCASDESARQLLLRQKRPRPYTVARVLPEEHVRRLPSGEGRGHQQIVVHFGRGAGPGLRSILQPLRDARFQHGAPGEETWCDRTHGPGAHRPLAENGKAEIVDFSRKNRSYRFTS